MLQLTKFHLYLLAFLVVCNTTVVLIGRYTRSSLPYENLFSINHLIIVTECSKFVMALLLEELHSDWGLKMSLKNHVVNNPRDALKMLVISILYLIQNSLLYVALSYLSVPVFQVLYQSKLCLTALLSVLMLGRTYHPRQWVCLGTMVLGITCVVVDGFSFESINGNDGVVIGIGAVLLAGLGSSFAGVYFEKLLKYSSSAQHSPLVEEEEGQEESKDGDATDDHDSAPTSFQRLWTKVLHIFFCQGGGGEGEEESPVPSLWMRNIQLSFFAILIAVGKDMYDDALHPNDQRPFFHGFTVWVWLLVLFQGVLGLLVAAVIKYADNVVKGLAVGVAVVLSSLLSCVLFQTTLRVEFFVGAILVLGSVFGFGFQIDLSSAASPQLIPREFRRRAGGAIQNVEDSLATPLLVV